MISILIIIISTSHVSLENTMKFSATKLFQGKPKDGAMTGHIEVFFRCDRSANWSSFAVGGFKRRTVTGI